jgi:hypothetical protein
MTKYELRITGECKQNLKICKKRDLRLMVLRVPPRASTGMATVWTTTMT